MHFLASQLHVISVGELRDLFDSLKVIDIVNPPIITQEDIDKLKPYTDLTNCYSRRPDWYDLLTKTRHDVGLMIQSGHILDVKHKFTYPQYSYAIDFIENTFECDECAWHIPFDNLEAFMGLYEQMQKLMIY
jgi:hypothetical protein